MSRFFPVFLCISLFSGGLSLLPLPTHAQATTSSTTTVSVTTSKAISGDHQGYALSDFSYRYTGNGIDTIMPHAEPIDLGLGTYTIEEIVPAGFVKADWRIGWYGECDYATTFSTTITINQHNIKDGNLNCDPDNQYRPDTPTAIPGCTDPNAPEYDPNATVDDASCTPDDARYLLEGYVWHDNNEDGVIDSDEDRLEDWVVTLAGNGRNATTSTDANGYYVFTVTAGTYTLSEYVETGWEQVYPTPVTHTAVVPEVVSALTFPFNLFVSTAQAATPAGPFNFGNVYTGNNGGGNGGFSCTLTADRTTVNRNDTVVLTWNASGATSLTIDNGIGSTTSSGSSSVTIVNDITYTATASDGTSTTSCSTAINIRSTGDGGTRSPQCQDFTISDTTYRAGDTYTLNWDTKRGRELSITAAGTEIFSTATNTVVDNGSMTVTPAAPTTYELTVSHGSRSDTCSVAVTSSGGGSPDGDGTGGGSYDGTGGGFIPQVLGEATSVVPIGAPNAGYVRLPSERAYLALGIFLSLLLGSALYLRRRA